MIIHKLIPKAGLAILTPEDAEDLWVLRRVITPGDLVSGETSRVLKDVGDYVRPDKGERINISVTLNVKRVMLDSTLERLRIVGEIVSSSSEMVSKGSSHSLVATPMRRIGVKKEWLNHLEIGLLKRSRGEEESFVLIAIDRREAGFGVVKGVHLQILPAIQSGLSGKFYRETHRSSGVYFKKVEEAILSIFGEGRKIYVVGPGPTKYEFVNLLSDSGSPLASSVTLVEGVDSSGDDGVYLALHSPSLKEKVAASKIGQAAALLDEAVRRISVNDDRLAIGFSDVSRAAGARAVESLLVSDRIFELGVDEDAVVELLNTVESLRGKTFLIDSSTDLGVQVSRLGGVVALLRFPVYLG